MFDTSQVRKKKGWSCIFERQSFPKLLVLLDRLHVVAKPSCQNQGIPIGCEPTTRWRRTDPLTVELP